MFLRELSKTMFKFSKKQTIYLIFKRLADLFLAILLLIILSPLFLIISILVKLSSSGKVIFKQKRTGKHKKIFTIYKFRTMKSFTELDGIFLSDYDRITKIGSFLRKSSLDELPQIINVLKGDMSFIGPRPFLINDLGTYTKKQEVRFNVLPGITSWTSVNGRNSLTLQQKYDYEIYYIENLSLKLDVKIFLKTLLVVVLAKNTVDEVNNPRIAAKIKDKVE